jgi:hypothetical protein
LEKVTWNESENTTFHSSHSGTVCGAYGTLVDRNDDGKNETGLGSGETGLIDLTAQRFTLKQLTPWGRFPLEKLIVA